MSDELEEMKQETQKGNRFENAEQNRNLNEDILAELEAIENGEGKTIAIRDESLSALFGALEDRNEELATALDALADEAGKDADSKTKSEVLRLAARVGLQTATPELWDAVLEARREQAAKNA
jgi:ribosomal protein L10